MLTDVTSRAVQLGGDAAKPQANTQELPHLERLVLVMRPHALPCSDICGGTES